MKGLSVYSHNFLAATQEYAGLLVVSVFGALIRLFPALSSSFPLSDGGLFYVMAQELHAANLQLPDYVSYNGGKIAFIYPPLGHYLLAVLTDVTQTPLIILMRLLPPLLSIFTIPAFYFLALSLSNRKSTALISTCAFATLPSSIDWLIMGGSITRTPGFLFALLALNQAILLYRNGQIKNLILTTVFSSLTIYSHPAMAWFVLYSSILLFIFAKPNFKRLSHSLIVAVSVALLTAPWWFTITSRFGLQPLINALVLGAGSISYWSFILPIFLLFTNEPLLDLQAVIGLLGAMVVIRERKPFLLIWFLAVFVLQTRESAIVASIPFATLVGLGIGQLILPNLSSSNDKKIFNSDWRPNLSQGSFLLYITVIALFSAYSIASSVKPISPGDIDAMTWIKTSTPDNSRFVLILGVEHVDVNVSEWFPALSKRISVNTGEGLEWSAVEMEKTDPATLARVQSCSLKTVSCIEEWASQSENYWDHLYLPVNVATMADGSTSKLFESLISSSSYKLVFQSESVFIFHRLDS